MSGDFRWDWYSGITPWNFPVNLVAHKVSPALGSGKCDHAESLLPTQCLCGIEIGKIILRFLRRARIKLLPDKRSYAGGKCCWIELLSQTIELKWSASPEAHDIGWDLKKKAFKQKVGLELGG